MIRHFISVDKQSHRPERGCRVAVWVGKSRASPWPSRAGWSKPQTTRPESSNKNTEKGHFLRMRATERDVNFFNLSIPENSRKKCHSQVTSAFQDFHCDILLEVLACSLYLTDIYNLSSSHRRTPRWWSCFRRIILITATATNIFRLAVFFFYNFKAQFSTVSNGCEKIIQHF